MHCYPLALLFLAMSGRLGDCAASVQTALEGNSPSATTTLSTVLFSPEIGASSSLEAYSSSKTSGAKCTGPSEEIADSVLQPRKQPKLEAWDLPQGDGQVKCRKGNEKDFPKSWGNAGFNPSQKVAQTLLDKARSEICEAPPRKCVRVSCSNYSAIFLCNDSYRETTKPSCHDVGVQAREIFDRCEGPYGKQHHFAGMKSIPDHHYTVLYRRSNC